MVTGLLNKIKYNFLKKNAVYEAFYVGLFYFWWFRFYEGVGLQHSLYKAMLFAVAMLVLRPIIELLLEPVFEFFKKFRNKTK